MGERERVERTAVFISVQNVLCCRFVCKCHLLHLSYNSARSHKSAACAHIHVGIKTQNYRTEAAICPHSANYLLCDHVIGKPVL